MTETESRTKWRAEVTVTMTGSRYTPEYEILHGMNSKLRGESFRAEIEAVRWTIAMLHGLVDATEAQLLRLAETRPDAPVGPAVYAGPDRDMTMAEIVEMAAKTETRPDAPVGPAVDVGPYKDMTTASRAGSAHNRAKKA